MRNCVVMKARCGVERVTERGSAIVPALLVVSVLSMLGMALLASGISGARTANFQADEYELTSAVESVAILATEDLWGDYIESEGGAAGNIASFRAWLDSEGIMDQGTGGPPPSGVGSDRLEATDLPEAPGGATRFSDVNLDGLWVYRRDSGDATQLYITVNASTTRGEGLVHPVLNRSLQLAYTVEPETFEGFDFGILANNVNCVFCHTQVDSSERYYNTDTEAYGSFERIKVGTLESLMLRHDMDGRPNINDYDADSVMAGTLYVRGAATDHNGVPISNWSVQSQRGFAFDGTGLIQEDVWGDMSTGPFSPAGDPPLPFENLYLDYPADYTDMVDGRLPTEFPCPFPDDGGLDPATGLPDPDAIGNKRVDPAEFYAVAQEAEGSIIAGVINVSDPAFVIDTIPEYAAAIFIGNQISLPSSTVGNVVLSGEIDNPIVIDGEVAIDGDVVIQGYVKGSGAILASGNIFVPTDLVYLDGQAYLPGDPPGSPSGQRTFGIAPDGTKNALGLSCGGNIMLGDYLKPSVLEPDGSGGFDYVVPGKYEIVNGDNTGKWSFGLAELCLFNRTEWARTQPVLPGPGEDNTDPATWTIANPDYRGTAYTPRYYNFGPGDTIAIYNLGNLYFDENTGTWMGDTEVPLFWKPEQLTMVEPEDTGSPLLFDQVSGDPIATISQLTPTGTWLTDFMQKLAIEYYEDTRVQNTPMEIDGLLYTNNAIFGIVSRVGPMRGQLLVNGALVCADLGVLAPGFNNPGGTGGAQNVPNSPYAVGLRLNYDRRVKGMLNVTNPNQVVLKRTLWNPTVDIL
ncbi:MAG TPA: hypothetical protein QF730_08105 [Planctomycetota bacterium]|nr:hypothetical protein [Planctomycetota bacterium]